MKLFKNIKNALIEEVTVEDRIYAEMVYPDELEPEIVAVTPGNANTLIDDIYTQNHLTDRSRSIYKIDELLATLPREMVTETKRNTILMILGSFGLNPPQLSDDGENRILILDGVLTRIVNECNQMMADKQTEIENHKRSIALLEKQISDHKRVVMDSDDIISSEIAAIKQLITFMEGD